MNVNIVVENTVFLTNLKENEINMKKKAITMFLTLLICSVAFSGVAGYAIGKNEVVATLAKQIKITNEGRAIDIGNDVPLSYKNTTYLPVRAVSEALGYDVKWFGDSNTVNLSKPDSEYPIISLDGIEIVDAAPSLNLMSVTAIHSVEVIINQTKEFDFEPVLIFEVLKNGVVIDSQTKKLEKTSGRSIVEISSSQFSHEINSKLTHDEKLAKYNEQFSYRLKIK